MFLNSLYTIAEINSGPETIAATIAIDPAHVIFSGHFPGAPVMPGVVQLQIVKELLEQHLKRQLRMKTMRTCKFLQIINPQETPEIKIDLKFTTGEMVEVIASGSYDGVTYFKAQVSYI
ncbi:3-hydroxyacyl-ACP dehydratase [Dyadobacter sp. LHD-138]|uniref:3-hydroxyacyl-ACP dehydratase n=1 Tax=Dyadobacter sp. LHD-138 TaxID=3071413 RepID=UPI0027E12EA5|nr:3-hydroxyacyl-ACP dehydratase [Dyadobacter sp. LHD-138]MDQ6477981.1 3-hydroxyacyl-ACP dehydratase [Dyadobacter sp. LHD-138]